MPLSWNEIRQNAIAFAREWFDATRKRPEAQTFWNEFFQVFGVRRRRVASFEEPVRNLSENYDFIDLLWPGTLIAEHKSRGQSLSKAESQAMAYTRALIDDDRREEVPRGQPARRQVPRSGRPVLVQRAVRGLLRQGVVSAG